MIPVWFFAGLLLGIYGVLILVSGLVEWSHPPATVLADLHARVGWGALLVVTGGIYRIVYWPRKNRPGPYSTFTEFCCLEAWRCW
jgi:hypothetical protein